MANSLDDIFNDDRFGLLNKKPIENKHKTDDERLIDAFEEINLFYEKNNREPATGSMGEFSLLARLKSFRSDHLKVKVLKPYDKYNLLSTDENKPKSLDEVFAEDPLGLLNTTGDTSIFNFNHTPKPGTRASTDFTAQRKPMSETEFKDYELMFQQVHRELKLGKRKLKPFDRLENNLQQGNFYLLDGLLLYLQTADIEPELRGVNTGGRVQLDGRTLTIFENGTKSNMLFRSLGKSLQKNGKIVTQLSEESEAELNTNFSGATNEDLESGWIYVLRSKSKNSQISMINHLYKIGFSSVDVKSRIKNASHETTYLNDEVEVVATYRCFNVNTRQLENLIHRFFGDCCLNVEIHDRNGNTIIPREWFVVPLPIIDETIELILNGNIINYHYDIKHQVLRLI